VQFVANVASDCEGLFGSSTPVARRIVSREYRSQPSADSSNITARPARGISDLVKEHRKRASMGVSLTWARTSRPLLPAARREPQSIVGIGSDGEQSDDISDDIDVESDSSLSALGGFVQANSRDLITKNVYPRLLYAFSDVVCFVTSNARLVQSLYPLNNSFPSAGWVIDIHTEHRKKSSGRYSNGLRMVSSALSTNECDQD